MVGAAAAASARAVAERSDVVFTSLPWPATVKEVYPGAGGAVEGARPGTILVDMSTVDPETTRAVHAAAAARGVHHVNAPVSGGYREAENGTLVIIVGGERDAFDRARPVLDVLGASVHHMARSHDVPVPATSLLHQLYSASSALGDGPNDFAAIVKLFESWARAEVRGA